MDDEEGEERKRGPQVVSFNEGIEEEDSDEELFDQDQFDNFF